MRLLRRLYLLFLFLIFWVHPAALTYARGEGLQIDADQQFQFAEAYLEKGNASGAISEFERFIHFFPDDSRVDKARFGIGIAKMNAGNFENAIESFQELIETYGNSDLSVKSYLMISTCYERLNAYHQAISTLRYMLTLPSDSRTHDDTLYRMGWLYMETASWDQAIETFTKISDEHRSAYPTDSLISQLQDADSIPRKKPGLAGALSIIPGLGYLYCERYRDALTAFLFNGALIAAAYESFDNELYALGGVISFVGLGFYSANIYGAVGSAHKYNQTQQKSFIEKLKQNMTIGISIGAEQVMLSIHYPF